VRSAREGDSAAAAATAATVKNERVWYDRWGRECRGEKDEGSECGYVGKGIGEKQSISFWLWFETPDDDDGGGELKKRRKEKVERET